MNFRLMVKILAIALKLLATPRMRIFRAGSVRAAELLRRFEERHVFDWAPQVRTWLTDASYIFHLGLGELLAPNSHR